MGLAINSGISNDVAEILMKITALPLAIAIFLASAQQASARFMPEEFKIKKDPEVVQSDEDC